MKLRLWIDDKRTAPDEWLWAKTSKKAIALLKNYSGMISEVSFDHDLGGDDTTRPVVMWLCENEDEDWPPICHVHSSNPCGIEWLEGMINRYGPGVS